MSSARTLRARVLMGAPASALSELMVDEHVRLVETQMAQPLDKPMTVTGDRIHVVDADKLHAAVTVTGTPAQFDAPRTGTDRLEHQPESRHEPSLGGWSPAG